jgi:hypothetical protein
MINRLEVVKTKKMDMEAKEKYVGHLEQVNSIWSDW